MVNGEFAGQRASGLVLVASALLGASSAQAVTVNGLGAGFEHIYGSYAPGGDCTREPRVTIGAAGLTFHARGQTVTSTRMEYAASFFGNFYEGITLAFFPFPRGPEDFGPVIMYVNDDDQLGTLRIEANAEPGQRLDPFHSFVAGRYLLCPGTGSAVSAPTAIRAVPVAGTPLEWTNLSALLGRYPGSYSADNIDLFDKGAIAAALRAALGEKMSVLETNLATVTPLQRQGNLYFIMGNAAHRGGEDQAYVMIDPTMRAVQVGLWEQGKLTVYSPAQGRLPEPREVRELLARSPGETANVTPGTPWEILPVQGRASVAYVEAAASPSIASITLYCENGQPYMALLLVKPGGGTRSTMTWNFVGGAVDFSVQRANSAGTYWVGGVSGSPLIEYLMKQNGSVHLRIDGRLEGEVSLTDARAALRATMRQCASL